MKTLATIAVFVVFLGLSSHVAARLLSEDRLSVKSNGCACVSEPSEHCGCCAHIKFNVLHVKVDDDACINITYLPSQVGLSLTFSWNGKVELNETVSATNPPPICFGIPHVELLKICIRLSNISYDKKHFGGCISLEFEFLSVKKDFPLGCIYKNGAEVKQKVEREIERWDRLTSGQGFVELKENLDQRMREFEMIFKKMIGDFGDFLEMKKKSEDVPEVLKFP